MSTPSVSRAGAGAPPPPRETDDPRAAAARSAGAGRTSAARRARAHRAEAEPSRARALEPPPAAPAAPAWPAPGGAATAVAGYAPAASGGEWAFLDAKGTSIEDKLFLFMKKVMEKTDKELVDKMKEYKARFGSAPSSSSRKGMSLFDVAKSVVPALGVAADLVGEAGIKKLASSLGGPVLAAAATAAGMPQLAPLALRYGGDLAALAFKDVGGSSAGSAAAPAGSPDEKLAMLELQVLVEKQQRMFEAVSGTLKAMHDAEMAAIHNLR